MKRNLCAFLALLLCMAVLSPAALAGDESLSVQYVTITEDGFVADSLNGVAAIYNLTTSSPDCLDYIQRYYREIYGLEVQALGHEIWVSNSEGYAFVPTDAPKTGDIGYATAEERGKSCGHYVMCKRSDAQNDTITLIEQNWIWDGKASYERTVSYTQSCYQFYTLVSTTGEGVETPDISDSELDDGRTTTGALSSAPLGAQALLGSRSAAEVLGGGSVEGSVSSWAQAAVSRAREWGISAGISLRADEPITRGEFAALLVNTAYGLGMQADLQMPTLESARLGLMMGDDRGNFNAEGTLTREMAAVVLSRLWQMTGDTLAADEAVLSQFEDAAQISAWARSGAAMAVQAGLISGTGRGFDAQGTLTGEQAITLLARLFAARTYVSI